MSAHVGAWHSCDSSTPPQAAHSQNLRKIDRHLLEEPIRHLCGYSFASWGIKYGGNRNTMLLISHLLL